MFASTCSRETHHRPLARKWLKTPHNRFKMPQRRARTGSKRRVANEQRIMEEASRSQPETSGDANRLRGQKTTGGPKWSLLVAVAVAAAILALGASIQAAKSAPQAATSQERMKTSVLGASWRQRPLNFRSTGSHLRPVSVSSSPPANSTTKAPQAASPQSTRLEGAPAGVMKLEAPEEDAEEVRLVRDAAAILANRGRRANQNPRVIQIPANINGRLMAPIRVLNEDEAANETSAELNAQPEDDESTQEVAATTAHWGSPAAGDIQRGTATGAPAAKLQEEEESLAATATTSQTDSEVTPCSQQQQADNSEAQHAASMAASSPTLRLVTATAKGNRSSLLQQLLGSSPPPESRLGELDSAAQPVELRQDAARPTEAQQSAALTRRGQQQEPGIRLAAAESAISPVDSRLRSAGGGGGDSILSLIDDYDSKITTNRTKAQLSCDSGEMVLRLNFSDSFKGIVYPDHNRLSPCRFFGDGHHNYELRLPLRGCGTRQAASRVFVNDVIVRFHKTLELEEDEVKTLICRYPPPLAPDPLLDGPTLNPAVTGATSSSNRFQSTAPTTLEPNQSSVLEQEAPSQFEFVDTLSGRPKAPEPPGSSGNVETLSENLIVAPVPGNGIPPHPYQQQDAQPGSGMRQRHRPDGDPLNSRNSQLLDPVVIGGPIGGQQKNHAAGLLERFSSIELLFIISSLMFLVLLVLGLATSYYCFRRQAHRGSVQRASAILKRKRRYVGPGALLHEHHPAAVGQAAALQQYYSQRLSGGSGPAGHRRPSLTAPSSPESDLSARGLLGPTSTSSRNLARGHHHHYHPSYNQAFVPDTIGPSGATAKHYAASPYLSAPAYGLEQPGMVATTGRRQRGGPSGQQAPTVPGGPVLGRRETVYGRSQQRYLSPPVATLSRSRPSALAQFTPVFGQVSTGKANPMDQPQLGPPIPSAYGIQQQVVSFNESTVPAAGHLSRAKSLSSVRYLEPLAPMPLRPTAGEQFAMGGTEAHGRRRRQRQLPPAGELFVAAGQRSGRGLRRANQSSFTRRADKEHSSDSEIETNNNGGKKTHVRAANQPQAKPSILLKSIEDSYITNFTEIYEQEYVKRDSTRPLSMSQWRALQPQRPPPAAGGRKQRPNSRGPLDADCRSDMSREGGDSDNDEDDDVETVRGQDERYHTSNLRSLTELDVNFAKPLLSSSVHPSTSLRAARSVDQLTHRSGPQSGSPDERATSSSDVDMADVTPPAEHKLRASSAPHVADADQQQQEQQQKQVIEGDWTEQSPDLILSPDYDHRLELSGGAAHRQQQQQQKQSSHNSVSYV